MILAFTDPTHGSSTTEAHIFLFVFCLLESTVCLGLGGIALVTLDDMDHTWGD